MADELAALEAEPGSIPAPEDGETVDPNLEAGQNDEPDPIAELAKRAGWTPKEEFKGDPDKWRPADEYLLVGKDTVRSMSRELKGVREEVTRIARTSADMTAQAVAERDRHWQTVHRQAVEEGNVELAERAVEERSKLKQQAPADTGEPAETQDFKGRHSAWFGKNRLATGRAMEVAERSRAMGATVAEQLEDAESAVRREFPELFAKPKPAPSTQTGTSRNAHSGSRKKGYADMPAESRAMADDYLKRHGVPLEKTAESYWADIERTERKVG